MRRSEIGIVVANDFEQRREIGYLGWFGLAAILCEKVAPDEHNAKRKDPQGPGNFHVCLELMAAIGACSSRTPKGAFLKRKCRVYND